MCPNPLLAIHTIIAFLKNFPMVGYMYILECSDGSYYVGSTVDLVTRFKQHMTGEGARHTRKRLPVKLTYFEKFKRIDHAYHREKQVQRWSRKKKEALINSQPELLNDLAKCMNGTSHKDFEALKSN